MPKFNDEWIVGPHGPLEQLDQGLYTVAAEIRMPLGNFPRRMTVIALRGGRVAIWSAVPLREPEMARIEALGAIAFLIVPGVGHRLDLKPWRARYPEARILCAPGARAAVEDVAPVAATADILDDPEAALETVGGTGEKEAALLVTRGGRETLVLNDILANVRHPHGLGARMMARLMRFGVSRPQMPWPVKRMFVENEAALAADLRRWAARPSLARILVSHGDPIERAPQAVLARVADALAD